MDKSKSSTISISSGAEQASTESKDATTRHQRIRTPMVQNVLLIWLDNNIDDNNADCRNTITQLRRAVNDINTFTDGDECIEFIDNIMDNKACMIISGSLGQHIVPHVHNMPQVDSILIFCSNKKYDEEWANDWPKVKGVFTEISSICEALKQATRDCEQNTISISFVATSDDTSKKNLDQLDPIFMYSQILKEILLTIQFDDGHIKQYIDYCNTVFAQNDREPKNPSKLQTTYRQKTPIWWYTCESFLYSMLNCALRLMNIDIIIKMGFFIGDLHRHIEQLHSEQFGENNFNQTFTVYRGQGMSKFDFDQMSKIQGGLMSFNNFLSTNKDRQVSLCFAESNSQNPDLIGILFVMTIDPVKSTTPFASIADVGYYDDQEHEVLFSMHSIFRIGDIKPMDENQRLFQVELTLTSDNDKDLRVLTDYIREETFPNAEGWERLGLLLLKVGESDKALHVYETMLEQTTDDSEKGGIYHQLGSAKYKRGEYQEAITFYEKALEIQQQSLPSNHSNLGSSYNNIANVYYSMGDYLKALSYYEKVLAIRQQSLPSNHLDVDSSYSNIGLVYSKMGDYPKALSSHEKALEIRQQSLPSNHPDLGGSYNNIGLMYFFMGDYPKALSSHEKALAIRKQSLPPNHPDLSMSYNNIGALHAQIGDYPKALSYYEKAFEIQKQLLPSNHPSLGTFYNNIGTLHAQMGDYPKALSSHEKALEIQQQSLSSNHPDLGMSYNSIGLVYRNMGDYPKALSYYEKGHEISEQTLPSNHPDLGDSYNNAGNVYFNMEDYPKALSSHEKALEIRQQSLASNHPNLGMSYNNIGAVYQNMGDYSKALSYYSKALEVKQQSLPSNHPDLGVSYNNIGLVYAKMGDYSKACSFYERAMEIGQQSLPTNHPHLKLYKKNLENVKKKL